MLKEDYDALLPFLNTLSPEQLKVVWYLEAIKKGNPCLTEVQKKLALSCLLIEPHKIILHDWHKPYSNTD